MKKINILILSILVLLLLTGCGKITTSTSMTNSDKTTEKNQSTIGNTTVEEGVVVKDNSFYLSFDNGKISSTILKSNGSMVEFRNKASGIDYIENSSGANWSFIIDTSTSDPYCASTSGSNTINVSSRSYQPKISYIDNNGDLTIKLDYEVSIEIQNISYSGIQIIQEIEVGMNDDEIIVNYQIFNDMTIPTVLVNFTGLIMTGINDKSLSLFYPQREGVIYENAVFKANTGKIKLSYQYPKPASTQLLQLFNDKGSLYYYVKDTTAEYKEINFGTFGGQYEYDYDQNDSIKKVSLSCTEYPFIPSGESKKVFPYVLGTSNNSGWYDGADSYQTFLVQNNMTKTYNSFVENWTGFTGITIAQYGNVMKSSYIKYDEEVYTPTESIASYDNCGFDTILLFGWHKGGFDSKYPDYEFFDGEGYNGVQGFTEMVDQIHKNRDSVIPYLNIHIAADNSNWSSQKYNGILNNLEYAAIKKEGYVKGLNGSNLEKYLYRESYGTGTYYHAMCPVAANFKDAFLDAAQKLVKTGVNGLWIDQLMEMPAYLCFDKDHGHESPATAYKEGYKEILETIIQYFSDQGTDDYLLFCEGVSDAWIKYIDICGLTWWRTLYYDMGDYTMNPSITKYTIPAKFLGINGYGLSKVHAYAFLLGSPFADGVSTIDIACTNVYKTNPEIYFTGAYKEMLGLSISNKNVLGSIIVGSDGKSLGIQLYNNSDIKTNVEITVDFLKIFGVDKEIVSLTNMFTNTNYQKEQNKFSISLDGTELTSIKIIYK